MESLLAVLQSLEAGLPILVLHLGVASALWAASIAIYLKVQSSQPLMQLIRQNNVAAAITVGGIAISSAIPLAFCLAGSINVWDIVVWSVPILIIQFVIFHVMNLVVGDLPGHIGRGDVAVAVYVFATRMGVAALLSAAIAG